MHWISVRKINYNIHWKVYSLLHPLACIAGIKWVRGGGRGGWKEEAWERGDTFLPPVRRIFRLPYPFPLTPVTQATPFDHVQVYTSQAAPQHFVLSGSGTHL